MNTPPNPLLQKRNTKIHYSEIKKNQNIKITIINYNTDYKIFENKRYKNHYIEFENVLLGSVLDLVDGSSIDGGEYVSLVFPLRVFSNALEWKGLGLRVGFNSLELLFMKYSHKYMRVVSFKYLLE